MTVTHQLPETTNEDISPLLVAGNGAVVTLVAGDTRLAVHRAVLTARSPVFATLLSHDTTEVSIPDVEGPVLRQVLAYMYTFRAPQFTDMAAQLLAAADKYNVVGLKALCEQQVAAQLNVENATETALLAVRYSCPDLEEAAVTFIKAHIQQVMATEGWADALANHPHIIGEVAHLFAAPQAESGGSSGDDEEAAQGS